MESDVESAGDLQVEWVICQFFKGITLICVVVCFIGGERGLVWHLLISPRKERKIELRPNNVCKVNKIEIN